MQNGVQPIHIATGNGHLQIVAMLIDEFGVKPWEKYDVSVFILDENV